MVVDKQNIVQYFVWMSEAFHHTANMCILMDRGTAFIGALQRRKLTKAVLE